MHSAQHGTSNKEVTLKGNVTLEKSSKCQAEAGVKGGSALRSRLEELDARQESYERLEQALTNLPQRVRYKALVPLGPRLFALGEIVRTNELLVLLGQSGNATYFAERSAYQAKQIVQRRKDAIQAARRSAVAKYPAEKTKTATMPIAVPTAAKLTMPVSDADEGKDLHGIESEHSTDDNSTDDDSPLHHRERSILKAVSTTSKTRKACGVSHNRTVRFAEDLSVTEKGVGKTDKSHASPLKTNRNLTDRGDDMDNVGNTSEKAGETSQRLQDELFEAIRNAQQRVIEDDVINVTEFYADDDDDQPTHVEIPTHFRPDSKVSFAEDSNEYLDITVGRTSQLHQLKDVDKAALLSSHSEAVPGASPDSSIDEREAWLQDLLEAEKAFEEDEKDVENQELEDKAREEQKEFGSGFARGFLGVIGGNKNSGPIVKGKYSVTSKVDSRDGPSQSDNYFQGGKGISQVTGSDSTTDATISTDESAIYAEATGGTRSQLMLGNMETEKAAVKDVVVERNAGGRRRRKRSSTHAHPRGSVVAPQTIMPTPSVADVLVDADADVEEIEEDGEARPVSRFKQMQQQRRSRLSPT